MCKQADGLVLPLYFARLVETVRKLKREFSLHDLAMGLRLGRLLFGPDAKAHKRLLDEEKTVLYVIMTGGGGLTIQEREVARILYYYPCAPLVMEDCRWFFHEGVTTELLFRAIMCKETDLGLLRERVTRDIMCDHFSTWEEPVPPTDKEEEWTFRTIERRTGLSMIMAYKGGHGYHTRLRALPTSPPACIHGLITTRGKNCIKLHVLDHSRVLRLPYKENVTIIGRSGDKCIFKVNSVYYHLNLKSRFLQAGNSSKIQTMSYSDGVFYALSFRNHSQVIDAYIEEEWKEVAKSYLPRKCINGVVSRDLVVSCYSDRIRIHDFKTDQLTEMIGTEHVLEISNYEMRTLDGKRVHVDAPLGYRLSLLKRKLPLDVLNKVAKYMCIDPNFELT